MTDSKIETKVSSIWSLATDAKLETEGAKCNIVGDVNFFVAREGGRNSTFDMKFVKHMNDVLAEKGLTAADTGKEEHAGLFKDVYLRAYADCIVIGWENVTDQEGNPLECNYENIMMIFEKIGDAFNKVFEFSRNRANYREQLLEENVKK